MKRKLKCKRNIKIKSTINDLDSRASRTTINARIDQEELLVARAKGKYQEICTRLFQIPTKQSLVSKEIRRATPIGNISRTMARN